MNTLPKPVPPKPKCPPAKPPRRKLSYSSESGKGTSDSSLITNGTNNESKNHNKKSLFNAMCQNSENLEELNRNPNLSKSSSSASSASKESNGSPYTDIGSDYGSFHGDHPHLLPDCNIDHLGPVKQWPLLTSKSLLKTPQKALFQDFTEDTSTSHPHCCSTPLKSSNGINNSIYYTPKSDMSCSHTCQTPKKGFTNLYNANESGICEHVRKPSCCGVERRHNSDPQISLDRRPSRRLKASGKCSLLGRDKRSCVEETSRRKKRSQSFACNQYQHHHHHHHHHEAVVNESHSVLVLPHKSHCCLDSLIPTKRGSHDSLEDICHRIWKKHQSQSDWMAAKNNVIQNAGNFSEMLSEIYYAQKERDKAIQERLELVSEQRNELMIEVESLKEIIFRQNMWTNDDIEEDTDCDNFALDQLLNGLDNTCSPTKLEFHKEKILAKVYQANKGRKSTVNSKHSSQPQSLLDELNCDGFVCQKVSEERSKTIKKMTEMESDISSFHLYSLKNNSLNSLDNEKMTKLQLDEVDDDEEIGVFHIDSNYSEADEEIRAKLQKESKARHDAEDKCKKLERLVNVLRKKLAGTSIGVQV